MNGYFNNKTVLLTGGAGFIGSNLTKRLLELGAKVIAVDNYLTGRKVNIQSFLDKDNYFFIQADVSQAVTKYLDSSVKLDLVLHFASPASPPKYQKKPVETYLVNSIATHYLLSYLKETNPQARFIFASTSETYGDPAIHPQVETYWGNVNPNGKRSCYDEAKRLGETISGVFYRDFGLDARIVRIFNTYGPNMDPSDGRVISEFVTQALKKEALTVYGNGSQTRSYCYVDDLVEYILRMASIEDLDGETINIGNPDEHTVLETALIVDSLVNNSTKETVKLSYQPIPSDDPTKRKPDITKAKQLLDYQPKVSFEEGLKKTILYFEKELART